MDKHGFQALAIFFLVWKNDEKIWEHVILYFRQAKWSFNFLKMLTWTDLTWPQLAVAWSRILVPQPEIEVRLWQWECWILATRPPEPVASDKTWPVGFVELNSYKEMGCSETSKVFIQRELYMWIDSYEWTWRVSCPWEFESLIWGISSGFLWPIILLCLLLSLYLVYLRILSCVYCISSPRWILAKRPMGRLTSLTMKWWPLHFDFWGAFPCICSWEDFLDLEKEKYVVSSGQGSAPLLLLLLSSSQSICSQAANFRCSAWSHLEN